MCMCSRVLIISFYNSGFGTSVKNRINHDIDVIWASWCLKQLAAWLFIQELVYAYNEENMKTQNLLALLEGSNQLISAP